MAFVTVTILFSIAVNILGIFMQNPLVYLKSLNLHMKNSKGQYHAEQTAWSKNEVLRYKDIMYERNPFSCYGKCFATDMLQNPRP